MIPSHGSCHHESGCFDIDAHTSIVCAPDAESVVCAVAHLRRRIGSVTGVILSAVDQGLGAGRHIRIELQEGLGEGYELEVHPDRACLKGGYAGLIYGVETLSRLLFERKNRADCVQIRDAPFFSWRGLMLDCSRHFLTKGFILRTVDMLAALKMNRLHLHLVDDDGWRVEIKAFPELTATGAYVEKGERQAGFYTQEDLKEIVSYASDRGVLVVPEIEVPGHSFAAMKSYPWLCCTGKPLRGEGHQKDLYCAGKESSFEFLETVLGEVTEIFPSSYVHIGGDEAPKERWRACTLCQKRIEDEGLQGEEELQAYMIHRLAGYLRKKGKRIIGWEEIISGGPQADAIVHGWRYRTHGSKWVSAAIAAGHDVIASPNSFCYLSFPVHPDEHFKLERTSSLERVYEAVYIPQDVPEEDRARVLGAECCVWTEYLTEENIPEMLFPRILACSELMWRYPAKRDRAEFLRRVEGERSWWRSMGFEYGEA